MTRIITKFLPLLASLMLSIGAQCQVVVNSEAQKEMFRAHVKQVDEFIERFNCKSFTPGIDTAKADAKRLNLVSLFPIETSKSSEADYKNAVKFADHVLASGTKLRYEDTTWFAMAQCRGKLKNKPVEFTLFLNVEHRRGQMYKWVISRAQGEIFALAPSNTNEKLMISPTDHDINFMQLSRITTEQDDLILNYGQKQFDIDQTSVFFTMVNQGLLDIEHVVNLQFIFMQVPGYQVTIEYIDRLANNAGWLIKSAMPVKDSDKKEMLDFIYNRPKCDKQR